jgi:hypothetical protein
MHFSLSPMIVQRVELRLSVPNDAVTSVFPMSERWLRQRSDHQMAAKHVKGKHKKEKFRSLMDYLFANCFQGTFLMVYRYYEDKEPPLREILTREQCFMVDSYLVAALKVAHEAHCEKRARSWSQVKRKVERTFWLTAA